MARKNNSKASLSSKLCAVAGIIICVLSGMWGGVWVNTSEAVVQVLPRLNINGDILKDESGVDIPLEDFVLLGKFKHGMYASLDVTGWKNHYEPWPVPVLWRVMSGDAATGSGQRKVTLLANYLVDARRYNMGSAATPWAVSNAWVGSELQLWLNNTSTGFLTDFTTASKNALLSPSPDGIGGSKVTLPSLASENGAVVLAKADHEQYVYSGDLALWFGSNDSDFNTSMRPTLMGPHAWARLAAFKGGSNTNPYWTRSPVADNLFSTNAWQVSYYGELAHGHVLYGTSGGVRPIVVVDLGSVVFKSGVDNFELNTPSGYPAGDPRNPYVLVLPGDIPDGMTVDFISADMPPASLDMNEKTLTLEWDIPVSQAVKQWPSSLDFSLLRADGSRLNPVSIHVDGNPNKLILTFDTAALKGEVLTLDYNLNTDAISFDVTAGTVKVMNSFANRNVDNRTGRVIPPVDPPAPAPSSFSASVNRLSSALAPHSIKAVASYTCTTCDPIRSAHRAEFVLKPMPTHSPAGYRALASSFTADIDLGSGTVGNALALTFTIDADLIKGFENWKSMSEAEKLAHLDAQNIVFAYEYADGRVVPVIGRGGAHSWSDALKQDIASLIRNEIAVNYAIADTAENPYMCGNVVVIPDGEENKKVTGSVWFMQSDGSEKGGSGCDAGIGFASLLLLTCFAWHRRGGRVVKG